MQNFKAIKRPRIFLRISAALHGISRRIFEKGYIKDALEKGRYKYRLSYNAVVMKLILSKT